MESQDKNREWQLLEKITLASVTEQRKARRWSIFFKSLGFLYLFVVLGLLVPDPDSLAVDGHHKGKHTAVVDLKGVVMDEEEASAHTVVAGLREAFENKHSQAVMLVINSPGGSPVHAGYVYDEILRLRSKYPDKKVYAVIEDLGASAAYYIAAAADEIYADRASLVGSIGVISASFGFVEAMGKLGVERRVMTAGDNKAFLDPFQPLKAEERAFWEASLGVIHRQFIERVKQGRGDRLADDGQLFSGLIWSGEQALALGLIDGLGSPGHVAREVIGVEELVNYSVQPNPLDRLLKQLGASAGAAMARQLSMTAGLPVLR